MRVTFTVPAPSSVLVSNVLGLLGLAGVVAAVGGLTGNWWWSVLTAALMLVGLAYVTQAHAAAAAAAPAEPTVAAAAVPAAPPATAEVPMPPLARVS